MSTKKQTKQQVKQQVPKWFNGEIYTKGETVTNPFSKEDFYLNGLELSIYDFIMGTQAVFEMGVENQRLISDFQKALRWFQKNNINAYMVLLD
tara:strand:+ start:589 stop:867 length:279 start_codon:yes stop_codon:yes gene_type:complete